MSDLNPVVSAPACDVYGLPMLGNQWNNKNMLKRYFANVFSAELKLKIAAEKWESWCTISANAFQGFEFTDYLVETDLKTNALNILEKYCKNLLWINCFAYFLIEMEFWGKFIFIRLLL